MRKKLNNALSLWDGIFTVLFVFWQSATGGRVTVMQTVLPTVGPGALQMREMPTHDMGKVSSFRHY